MIYQVFITPTVRETLKNITDRKTRESICAVIDGLNVDPEKQGKPLLGELRGYRSRRAAGQRYRVIYRVEGERVIVFVVAVGIRKEGDKKDIYSLARKLFRLRLLGA